MSPADSILWKADELPGSSGKSGEVKWDGVISLGTLGGIGETTVFPSEILLPGGVAERLNAPVLKTGRPARVS
jgi:hypothetical protein